LGNYLKVWSHCVVFSFVDMDFGSFVTDYSVLAVTHCILKKGSLRQASIAKCSKKERGDVVII
jgi:hypothetical protein